ncbi:unnamed protein product [Leuciscus chuanchicus]
MEDACVTKNITTRVNQKPWMTSEVGAMLKARNDAFKAGHMGALRTAEANLNRAIRAAERAHSQKMQGFVCDPTNTKRMWQGMQTPPPCEDNTRFLNKLNTYFGRSEALNNTPVRKSVPHSDEQDANEQTYREEVRQLVDWCNRNNLLLNVDKTKEIIVDFRRKQHSHTPLLINNTVVELVSSTKLLGVQITETPETTTRVQISTSSISPYSITEHTSTDLATLTLKHTRITSHSVSRRGEEDKQATHQTETETTRTTTGNTTVQLYQTNTRKNTNYTTHNFVFHHVNIMCLALPSDLASVSGGLGSVLLVLTLCSGTFIILKKRKRKSGTALFQQNMQRNTETDRMYEEILNTDVAMVTSSTNSMPASSSNQTPALHLNTRPKVSTVYATVTNQQPDSSPSHTHSTNQVTDTAGDYYSKIKSPKATQDSGTELIYVTATHPQNISTNEGPIYSVINDK